MALQSSSPLQEQRTPFRNVQPEACEEVLAEKLAASKKGNEDVAFFDTEDIENDEPQATTYFESTDSKARFEHRYSKTNKETSVGS